MRTFAQRGYKRPSSRVLSAERLEAQHFTHTVAIWRPAPLEVLADGSALAGKLFADSGYQLVSRRQACFYNSTPETDEATIAGRTRVNNIFTLDVFIFPQGVELGDRWIILNLTPGDNYRRLYSLMGAPQSVQPGALHAIGGQRALVARIPTKEGTLPPGIDLDDVLAQ